MDVAAAMTVVILAGGLGTRLRSAVADVPKPMALIDGEPFLKYQLDHWIAAGARRFVLSVGYRKEAIVDYFGRSYRGVAVDYAVEEQPLGTGGGLLLAIEQLTDLAPFMLVNGDTFFDVPANDLIEFHRAKRADIAFALFRATEADRYGGLTIDSDGRIVEFLASKAPRGQLASGGVYCVEPRALRGRFGPPGKRLSLEEEIIPTLLRDAARLYGLELMGDFIDIGTPADYFRAASVIGPPRRT